MSSRDTTTARRQPTPNSMAEYVGNLVAASESRHTTYRFSNIGVDGSSDNVNFGGGTGGGHSQEDDILRGPDSAMRRAHIRQALLTKGCQAVDELLSIANPSNNNLSVEEVMFLAAKGNLVHVVKDCIENKGADPTKLVRERLENEEEPGSNRPKFMDTLLGAIDAGASQVVEYLLTKGGANANAYSSVDDGAPALWVASQHGYVYMIRLLLEHGANLNAHKRSTGNTSLFVASQNGHSLACSVLIQHGADLNLSMAPEIHQLRPPLCIAISSGRPDIMALLLNAGAQITMICQIMWKKVEESKHSISHPRPLGEDLLYQMKALLDQAKECTLLFHTNEDVKKHYQRARELEHQGRYRPALRSLVEAEISYLQFNNHKEPHKFQPSPPAWVQLQLDGERLTDYVFGCKGSDGRVSKWQRHVFYKDDLQPPRLIFYSAIYYAPHKKVYRWGGLTSGGLYRVKEEYPMWAFDVTLKQWAMVPTTGKSPGARAYHSAALLGKFMYIFAGSTGPGRRDSKLFRLNLDTKVWEPIKVKGLAPMSRASAAMCTYRGKLYVMGGESTDPMTDMWQFSPDKNKWKELRPAADSPVQPLERFVHGMWASQNKLYVFGGQGVVPNSSDRAYRLQAWSHLQCFDLETHHWIDIPNIAGDLTWNIAEFTTLPLYRGKDEPSSILIWGGYHETSNPDSWASHHVEGYEYKRAIYGDEFHDYCMPYRRRLLRFDCETNTWTNLKLLDSDIVMPTAQCWGVELWDDDDDSTSRLDDGLTRIMIGGGYGLTHDSKDKKYTAEEKLAMEIIGRDLREHDEHLSKPEISEQVYQVEILQEQNYCSADQALQNKGWAWRLNSLPMSQQPRVDSELGFGSATSFRIVEFCDDDFFDPPSPTVKDNDDSMLGRRVVLSGIKAKPELNGRVCRCGIFDTKKQRYQVHLEPKHGVEGLVTMSIKSSNLDHADPLDAHDISSILMDQRAQKPTPELVATWSSDRRFFTLDTRPHNLERFQNDMSEGSEPVTISDSYRGPFSAEGRAILHAVGQITPKARRTITLLHFPKRYVGNEARHGDYDIFSAWVRRVHERDANRSKCWQEKIVSYRKTSGWETDATKTKWLRVDLRLDGMEEPAITRSIIVSPLITMYRLHRQVLAPALGRRGNAHCYAFRQCHQFSLPNGKDGYDHKKEVAKHVELVHANWIGPKVSSAIDGFFQPFYIGGEMADDQKILLGDLVYRAERKDEEELHLRYIYDFGDWWSHTLTVTEYSGAVPTDASVAHVLSGYGACPPEDCGGFVEYCKMIHQLTGELGMKTDDFKGDTSKAPPEDERFVYPLKERWWKCANSMRSRTGFRGSLNQPMEFDLEVTRRNVKEALRQRLEKAGLESLQNRSQDLQGGLMATVPSEAGGSDTKVLKKTKNPLKMCAVCGVTAALQTCKGCGKIAYCGREHQVQHWKEHKTVCKQAQAAKKK